MRILIVEDDAELAALLGLGARTLWPDCALTVAGDGQSALHAFAADQPELVLLDIGLPPPNGLEVCRRIRAESRVPILVLTGREGVEDEVTALRLGADDYLRKPFDMLQLLARMRALTWRAERSPAAATPVDRTDVAVGDLTIDFTLRRVCVAGVNVELTSTEYVLLEELARHAGMVVPNEVLLERVWGSGRGGGTHALKVFISRLRQKLGDDAAHPRYIQTRWGVGYRFAGPG